jgi:FkbM family methyltransferase
MAEKLPIILSGIRTSATPVDLVLFALGRAWKARTKDGIFFCNDRICAQNFRQNYEDKIKRILTNASLRGRDEVFLDVGANIGYYSVLLSKHCKKIISIEPSKNNFGYLKWNLERNHCGNASAFRVAASDRVGTVGISERGPLSRVTAGTEVQTVRLDEFCEALDVVPTIIKIDAEYSEFDIFSGMPRLLKTDCVLVVESLYPERMRDFAKTIGRSAQLLDARFNYELIANRVEVAPSSTDAEPS